MDLRAAVLDAEPMVLAPVTGAKADGPDDCAACRIRSALATLRFAWKNGVTCLNTPGTTDADYRGEVKVLLINLGQEPFTIKRGERIAQMVIAPVTQGDWDG